MRAVLESWAVRSLVCTVLRTVPEDWAMCALLCTLPEDLDLER